MQETTYVKLCAYGRIMKLPTMWECLSSCIRGNPNWPTMIVEVQWMGFRTWVRLPSGPLFYKPWKCLETPYLCGLPGIFHIRLEPFGSVKNRIKRIISAIVVAFGDKNELLLLQIAGKLDYVFFTNEERLLGASALIVWVWVLFSYNRQFTVHMLSWE